MTTAVPSRQTVMAALGLAVRAPSVHNSQPWLWRVGECSVDLYANNDLHLPHTDPGRRDMLLSCGVALQHFTLALAALGWRCQVNRLPDPADPAHLAAIRFANDRVPPSEQDIAMAAAIPRRRSDRRVYSPWPVAAGHLALMSARSARAGVTLRRVPTGPLSELVESAVRAHSNDAGYLAELTMWSGRYGSLAGVPAVNAPASDHHSPIPARVFAGAVLSQPEGASAAADGGAVVALSTATDDTLAHLRAGEATGVVLLTATALGLSSCPVTEPLEVESTRSAARSMVLGGDGYPQMLLRIGWAPINADPLPATPRRPLDDVVMQFSGPGLVGS